MKRLLDGVLASLGLCVASPVLAAIALGVAVFLGRPVMYSQTRIGRSGVPFVLWKFRTMTGEVDSTGEPLPDERRLTSFGRWLRSTSLDELPELWNVLRGDMSLVGPRPLLPEYLPLYDERQARRHEVRPGITGWAQVNGRNAVEWADRLEMDVWYVENRSLMLDAKILAMTVGAVLKREGITQDGSATCEPFTGAVGGSEGDGD